MISTRLKKGVVFLLFMGILGFATSEARAQNTSVEKRSELPLEEEEGPLIYKFEPEFWTSVEQRKTRIEKMRAVLDTMDLKKGKRKRLLKDLYKNGISGRLSEVLSVETDFEDVDDIPN